MTEKHLQSKKAMKAFLFFLLFLMGMKGYAYDFYAVCPSGQTLFYTITDATNNYVAVEAPTGSGWSNYNKPTGDMEIPMTVTQSDVVYTVTSLGSWVFENCNGLNSVTIPSSVTSIGEGALSSCFWLSQIIVQEGNCVYDSRDNCNAIIETNTNTLIMGCRNTIIPNSITSIGSHAFDACSGLTSIEIPNSVISIGSYAFSDCDYLTSIVIPNSVTSIGESTFSGCSGLTSIEIPNSMTSIGSWAFENCNNLTSVIIPNSVTFIGEGAFFGCKLTSVSIPNSVTSIESYTFKNCRGLASITIPNSVTTIGGEAFSGCRNLDSIEIPNSLTSIGESAFSGCSGLTSIDFPNSVISIGSRAFENCSGLISITIPNSMTFIGESAFSGCSLAQIIVQEGNSVYDSRDNCNAIIETTTNTLIIGCENTIIPNSVTFIGSHAFDACSRLTSIVIPNSVTSIGNYAFLFCSGLTSIEFPNSVATIGESAFSGCCRLTSIEIPNSLISIGESAFYGCCTSLTQITVQEGNSVYDSRGNCNAIIETNTNTLIIGCENTIIPNSVTSIGNYAFAECYDLTSISIPSSVTSIGEGAFGNCNHLISITSFATTPPTLLGIINYNFAFSVPNSANVYVPCGTTEIYRANGWDYFYNFEEFLAGDFCPIDFADDNVKAICVEHWDSNDDGELSYAEAAAITDLDIYFKNNTDIVSFDELEYFSSLTSIPEMAFYGCTNLLSIGLPSSITALGSDAFYNCSNLSTMYVFAEEPPTLGTNAFTNVPTSMVVHVPCGITVLYQVANGWSGFSYIECEFHFITAGNWSIAENWADGVVPESDGEVYIDADCQLDTNAIVKNLTISLGNTLVINSEKMLTVTNTLANNGGSASNLVIADGAQLVHAMDGLSATVHKNITPYEEGNEDGWHLIASPLVDDVDVTCVPNLTLGDYDLYYYHEPTHYWMNEKNTDNHFDALESSKGYLYANQKGCITSEIQIGEGSTTTDYLPSYSYYKYSLSQQLYTAAEIGTSGAIASIAFYNGGAKKTRNYTIYMVTTDKVSFVSGTDWIAVSENDQVFCGSVTMVANDWTTITLDVPFIYDGASNLALVMDDNSGDWSNSPYMSCRTMSATKQAISCSSDNTNFDPINFNPYSGGIVRNVKNQIKIGFTNLTFAGSVNNGNATFSIPLSYTEGIYLAGFNLVGNPFVHNVTSYATQNVANGCFVMNESKDDLIVSEISEDNPLKPTEGFFVKATGENASITFNPSRATTNQRSGSIHIELSEDGQLIDRLLVKGSEAEPLQKISLNKQRAKLFATRGQQELAIVLCDGNEQPISFKANKAGEYTLSVRLDDMKVDYLHLIDNLTGANIDLLATPSYTFTAKTTDYTSRFKLVFDKDSVFEDEDGNKETFAFYNGYTWVISNSGEATLQVIDVTGRVLSSETINGNAEINISQPQGIYMLRLINGDSVMVQKVTVR